MVLDLYEKKALSFQEQLEQLQNRGLLVNDCHKAVSTLSQVSYYRLSAYRYPFRKRDDSQKKGVLDEFQENWEMLLFL